MKRNVDLTLNMDFRKDKPLDSLRNYFNKVFRKIKYPWDFEEYILSTTHMNELFLTGNKKQRQRKKESIRYEEGMECECCGKDLSNQPWNSYYRLCPRCDQNLEEDPERKLPWDKLLRRN